jgi:beta-lactamase superfamily II metal-dependent hydrolase
MKISSLFIIVALFVSLCSFASSKDEEFFIFDVGQGNSQLVLYKQAKLGFLYDAGSSSRQKHPKLIDLHEKDWSVFLTKKPIIPSTNLSNLSLDMFKDDISSLKNKVPRKISGESEDSKSQTISLKESDNIEDIEDSIKQSIEQGQLEWLLLFLSHPDKDHINLIQKSIPADLKVIAFLGGDFLGTESEKEVNTVLEFLKDRDSTKTWVEFPFYWGWNDPMGTLKTYQDLKRYFLTHLSNDPDWNQNRLRIKTLSLSEKNPEKFFQGTIFDLLFKTANQSQGFREFIDLDTKDLQNTQGLQTHLCCSCLKHLLTLSRYQVLANNTYVWAMNHKLYDINAQSSVLSFKLPENKVILTCTGDAEDLTFQRINYHLKLKEKDIFLFSWFNGYESFLMVPHHGSKNNISELMVQIFQPTVFVISAGNGKQYGHPDLETIMWLRSYTSTTSYPWISEAFEPKLIAFNKEQKTTTAYLKNSIKTSRFPIFSTNVIGTIRFTQKEFSSLFNSIFEINNYYYKVNFLTNVPLYNPISLEESGCFYKENEKYYFKVLNKENKPLYYYMEPIS